MYDFTEEEICMIVARDFYLSVENMPSEILEKIKMKIEVELRERDLSKENA
jgi:hypothetical protein